MYLLDKIMVFFLLLMKSHSSYNCFGTSGATLENEVYSKNSAADDGVL